MQVIAYIRLCRPGSILGPQQIYLHEQQARMWQAGNHQGQPVPRSVAQSTLGTVPASQSAPSRSRSVSSSQSHTTLPSAVNGSSYSSKPPASMGSMPHPASGGLAALDSTRSSSAAQLQRFTSLPARSGLSCSAPAQTRTSSLLLSRRLDASALVGRLLLSTLMLPVCADYCDCGNQGFGRKGNRTKPCKFMQIQQRKNWPL